MPCRYHNLVHNITVQYGVIPPKHSQTDLSILPQVVQYGHKINVVLIIISMAKCKTMVFAKLYLGYCSAASNVIAQYDVILQRHRLRGVIGYACFNTMRPRQNGCHFPDDLFKCIFLNENVWILIKISLKFVPKCPIDNISALVQIMDCRLVSAKPLSKPMIVRLPTHICITRPQWVTTKFLP